MVLGSVIAIPPRFMKKIFQRIFSKKGVIILGVISFLYILVSAALFVVASASSGNPAAFAGKDFSSLRKQVLSEGNEVKYPLLAHENYGASFYEVEKTVGEKTYYIYASGQANCSNYIGIITKVAREDYGLALGLTVGDFLAPVYQNDNDFILYSQAIPTQADGSPYLYYDYFTVTDSAAYYCSTQGELVLDHRYEDTWEIDVPQSQIDAVNAEAEGLLKDFFGEAKKVIESFSVRPDEVFSGIKRSFAAAERGSILLVIAAILSLPGAPATALFLLGLGNALIRRKRNRLAKEGRIPASEECPPAIPDHLVETEPLVEKQAKEIPLDGPVARFCAKTHIRPIFGEWVIRGLGLALITLAAVFMHLINAMLLPPEFDDAYVWFKAISSLGQLLLLVALIGIIAETRRGLTFTASAFMALAVTYYLAVNSVFFMLDTVIRIDFAGISFTQLLSTLLPGNLFMSMGLFTFIGLFLFEDPPEWIIKRKLFRALSLVPTSIAVASVVLSVLWSAELLGPNYWVSSFFFVRDFDGLVIGLAFIHIIFFVRSHLRKKYGKEHVDDLMERPSVQFQKNVALCFAVIAYAVIFYCLPPNVKSLLHLPDHTFVYALVPLFLFYKPAGKNRKMVSNIVYYALYGLSFIIPTIVTLIMR